MADVVEDSEVSTARRSEGLFYAARGFAGKAISAGGIIGAGAIVSLVGLDDINSVADVTYDARLNLATFFLPLYCSLFLIGLWVVSIYRIDRKGHASNLQQLHNARERRADLQAPDREPGNYSDKIQISRKCNFSQRLRI